MNPFRHFEQALPRLGSMLPSLAAVLATALAASCSDAPVSSDTSSNDPYAVQRLASQSSVQFSEIPSFEEMIAGGRAGLGKLSTDGDSTHHGDTAHHGDPPPHDTTHHDPPHDTSDNGGHHDPPADTARHHDSTHHERHHHDGIEHWRGLEMPHDLGLLQEHSYRQGLHDLGLSHEQDSLFRHAIAEYRSTVDTAWHAYVVARRSRLEELDTRLHDLHDAVRNGELSHDAARDSMHALVATYKADVAVLTNELRTAIDNSNAALDRTVNTFLTDEQMQKWNRMKG